MTVYMYDAVNPANIPADAQWVAGYVDGAVSKWPADAWSRWPNAQMVRITVLGGDTMADVGDVENGDMTPQSCVDWVLNRRAAGDSPVIYCNESTLFSVRNAFGVRRVPQPMFWLARPGVDESIPSWAVAVQFDFAGPYDRSAVCNYWPGLRPTAVTTTPVPPPPPGFSEGTDAVHVEVGQVEIKGSRGFFTLPTPPDIGKVVSVNVFGQTPSVVGEYVPVPAFVSVSSDRSTLEFGPGPYGPVADGVYGFEYWLAG